MSSSTSRQLKHSIEKYDLVCIGAGISGLYAVYEWCKRHPSRRRVLVLDKSARIGGRIQTVHRGRHVYEAGAGRFHTRHTNVWRLLRELGLSDKASPLPKSEHYFIDGQYMKTDEDVQKHYGLTRSVADIWRHIYQTRTEKAKTMSLLEYINSVGIPNNEVDAIITTFGYKSEFVVLNAWHSLDILGHDFNIDTATSAANADSFYTLSGGLSQIIDALYMKLIEYGVTFRLRTECWRVDSTPEGCNMYMRQYPTEMRCIADYCVIACPSRAFKDIRFYTHNGAIQKRAERVSIPMKYMPEPYSLYRMYACFPKDVTTKKVWFDGLPKIVTDMPISMIIPINYETGLIMISYSDDGDSDYWNRYGTPEEIQREIMRQLRVVFGNTLTGDIPEPKWMTYHYWNEGCHGWTKDNNGKYEWSKLVRRFESQMNNHVTWINEASSYHQGWMEGSLELTGKWFDSLQVVQRGAGNVTRMYTREEVAKHNKIDDAWTVISGNVYDITKWIPKHPGGALAIMQIVGKDGTKLFMSNPIHMAKGASRILNKYWIGKLQ